MFNLYERISTQPDVYRQFRCSDSLLTLFNCRLQDKFADLWSQLNYFVYVVEGRKIWHTPNASYDLQKGDCVFVKKGACIVEQFFEKAPCFIFFFMPDEFICEVLQKKVKPASMPVPPVDPVIAIAGNDRVQAFFQSMMSYFNSHRDPDQALLELKFKELLLTLADDAANIELLAYFCSLLKQPRSVRLQQVMEENFSYNLKLDEFARLSARSLSAFKRDFFDLYRTTPGKWLLEKRLNHAMHLLTHRGKTVSDAAFESGFENISHFSRVFRKRFGMPPASARQQVTA